MLPKFSKGNIKLGHILNFSLPNYITCPGKSKWCMQKCYVRKSERLFPRCKFTYAHNLLVTQDKAFVSSTIAQIKESDPIYFRIHPSGDFYDTRYILKWVQICKALPSITFSAYTRSWVNPRLLQALNKLSALDNVQIFYSIDPTMTNPPKGRIAFIDIDERADGVKCFSQNGIKRTCSECGFCYQKSKASIIFKVH